MPPYLHLHRSNRAEVLVRALAETLSGGWPRDPFEAVAIVVGSRGMERWLRHELATLLGVSAHLAFPFPRQALDGALGWLADADSPADAAFWTRSTGEPDPWQPDAVTFALVAQLRDAAHEPGFAHVAKYLHYEAVGASAGPRDLMARELMFAREVADVLDRLVHERSAEAATWQQDPNLAPAAHRWLATLLHRLQTPIAVAAPSALAAASQDKAARRLCIFGLSTLGPGDQLRIATLAQAMEVHLFVLAPSHVWWGDIRNRQAACRALRMARSDSQRLEVEAQLASQNSLLAALGDPSRDLQAWLEELTYDEPPSEQGPDWDDEVVPTTLLQHLQAWIGRADEVPLEPLPEFAAVARDGSISCHATYGALRQVEVLRDLLLGLFADPSLQLEPRQVLVMTPDIETYAPLVAAVFARRGGALPLPDPTTARPAKAELPAIPVAIADLGLARTNPLAEVLLQCLALASERLTVNRLADLLALEPVRRKFGLDMADYADVREMLQASNMRWGADAADRKAVDQPELDQNTIRFGLERLALGVLLPDDDDPLELQQGGAMPVAPAPVQSRDRVARLGKLMAFARTVIALRRDLQTARTCADWQATLTTALATMASTSDKAAWLLGEVLAELQALRDSAGASELRLHHAAVLRWLRGRFEVSQRGDRVITSAVTLCAMEPMRSVPFRVVVLLGMDDGVFPRANNRPAWDPFADGRRAGERDRREVDRHLLLEAILSARDKLVVLWSGRDVRSGMHRAAAVPIEEILECLGKLTGVARDELLLEHPLQPWSRRNFTEHGARSFGLGLATGIAQRDQTAGTGPGHVGGARFDLAAAAVGPEAVPPMQLTTAELAKGLSQPHNMLLRERMQLLLPQDQSPLQDREPLELATLDAWQQRNRLIQALAVHADGDAEAVLQRALAASAGRGELPLHAGGESVLRAALQEAKQQEKNVRAVVARRIPPPAIAVKLGDGLLLHASAPQSYAMDGGILLQWTTASKEANLRLRLEAWLTLLAAKACGVPVVAARAVGYEAEDVTWLAAPQTSEQAKELLEDALAIWRLARQQPVLLFEQVSAELAQVLYRHGDPTLGGEARRRAVAVVLAAWQGGERKTDLDDAAVALLFGDADPIAWLGDGAANGLVDLARRIWLPLLAAECSAAAADLDGAWTVAQEAA